MTHIVVCDCSELQSPGGIHYHIVTDDVKPIGADYVLDEKFWRGQCKIEKRI
jgi:hypothetical protein